MRALLVGALALLFVAPAAADPLILLTAPEDVGALYDEVNNTITLTWTHPDAAQLTFNVYQDGIRVASTAATSITIPAEGTLVYFVTAEDENGTESPPSRSPWPWPLNQILPDCSMAHIGLVFVTPHWWCVEEYREAIEEQTEI